MVNAALRRTRSESLAFDQTRLSEFGSRDARDGLVDLPATVGWQSLRET